ncbi:GUN4 domain-containing protein [Leptolyngbya sp. FACHB-541]|uniref:caspase, EACC1-associated type n=1 Tax=Leptolyngbya sp. FACHB-541 TaxID=2692810 RepID=UPI001687E7ED|nr:GUN4 domain-containing protein [Leptolyngbya sp. FACHB-541]MBD1996723.1 GUN4 domain-containing protein [Leptolyngbya sp. FACHB-541]
MGKLALLIGVSEYTDGLNPLPSAVRDVAALRQVLHDPQIGGFDEVTVLSNPERQDMADRLYDFFTNSKKDDLLLLFFSGHGVVNEWGSFHLASRSTRKQQDKLMPTTAIAASEIQSWMASSRARRQLVILDCCFAGGFAKGITAKGEGTIDIRSQLGGEGRAILTAATSTQYAFEQEGLELSIYSHYLVEGLAKGAADLDDDGHISVQELHEYVAKKVKEAAPAMTPEIYNLSRDTEPILIARSPKDDPAVKYRKEVRKLAEEDEGELGYINRCYLDDLQRDLGLDSPITQTIETEELEPYRQRKAKEVRYREVFEGAIQQRYPLTDQDRNGLNRLQKLLSLRDEDIIRIEQIILNERQLPRPQPTQSSQTAKSAKASAPSSTPVHPKPHPAPVSRPQPAPSPGTPVTAPQSSFSQSEIPPSPKSVSQTSHSPASRLLTRQQFLKWVIPAGVGVVGVTVASQFLGKQPAPSVDYSKLEEFLKAERWEDADQETNNLIREVADWGKERSLDSDSIRNSLCEALRQIDRLWLDNSEDKFGFSVQKEIYLKDCGGNSDGNDEEAINCFVDAVGWYGNNSSLERGGFPRGGELYQVWASEGGEGAECEGNLVCVAHVILGFLLSCRSL